MNVTVIRVSANAITVVAPASQFSPLLPGSTTLEIFRVSFTLIRNDHIDRNKRDIVT